MSSFVSYQAGQDASPKEVVDRTPQLAEGTIESLARLGAKGRHELLSDMAGKAAAHEAKVKDQIKMLPWLEEAVRAGEAAAANIRPRAQRLTIKDGKSFHENLTPNYNEVGRSALGQHAVHPGTVPVRVHGIQLSPEQALDYLDSGIITVAEYNAGLEAGMAERGMLGWKVR